MRADDFPVEVLFLRDDDIPQTVAMGAADLGMVGYNEVAEKGFDVDILEHLNGELAHSCLGVSVGSRWVAVDGTEVTVAVDQHISHGEVLGKTYKGIVNRGVTVRMVTTQNCTNGVGALTVCLFRPQGIFVHCVEDSSVYRLETIPYIRKGSGHDNRHGVVYKGSFHFLIEVNVNYSAPI